MRRRRERNVREKPPPVAPPVAPEEEEQRSEQEEYQCSGLLEQDLAELCARAGIASVPIVTVQPSPAAAEGPESCSQGERCIQVELENNDDPCSVCRVFLRGWKVEEEMLGVLSKCLPALGNLQTLHLWNAGLTDCMLPALGTMLARCPQLWSLKLEGNPLLKHSFHVLMGTSSKLSHLSLRNNCIGDAAAQLLGQSLSTLSSSNRSLLSLVLSFNRISDVGAGHIAEGLRWNRSLLSLSLAHNHIGDAGALKLAEVLQPFVLTHKEVVERRRLLMETQGQLRTAESSSVYALSPQGSVAADKLSPAKQSRGTTKKKELLRKEDGKHSKKTMHTPDPRPNRSRGLKSVIKEKHITEALEPPEPIHPLLEPGWHRDGNVILPGNRVLLNLNLSDNHITEHGLGALLAALERQQQDGAGGGLGLMRLSLKRNSFPSTCEAFTRLQELLQQRDTLPKPGGQKEEQGLSP